LCFAARNDFAQARRVVDLEAILQRALAAQLQRGPAVAIANVLRRFEAILQGPTPLIDRLRQMHALYRACTGEARPPVLQSASKPVDAARPLLEVPGIGPRIAAALAKRSLHTVIDLLYFLPRRYQGQTGCAQLAELSDGVVATVEAEVHGASERLLRGRRSLEVICRDATAALHLMWFRVPGGKAFVEQFKPGTRLRATGTVKRYRGRLQMAHPTIKWVDSLEVAAPGPQSDAIVPLYLEIDNLHPISLRRLIDAQLQQLRSGALRLTDPLPATLRQRRQLCGLAEALGGLHQPPAETALADLQAFSTPWQRRFIYDELLLLQLCVLQARGQVSATPGRAIPLEQTLPEIGAALMPFSLTGAQRRVLEEIEADLRQPRPMQRLLQGDVGCGKTAVALTAAAAVGRAGLQAILMAPTELLAEQHARSAALYFTKQGLRAALLTGHTPAAVRRQTLAALRDNSIQLLIGTHAVIQPKIELAALALGIVDEQHRFGVMQRARLQAMGRASLGTTPHMLVMTATPIPRTLALTVYGDLDASAIDELPAGRRPITTRLVRDAERGRLYARVVEAVAAGQQAYVVFPLVEGSDKEGMRELRDATSAAEELAAGPLKDLRLGLLHGRLEADAKDAVMRAFAAHALDVLVATTVIEVGIDVPNATVMVIEHAERFGLSQLHQLRGRVGRGSVQSQCYLLMRRPGDDAFKRLSIMEQTTDGFKIAEADLQIRGPGDFIGTRQAGLPELSMADLARDQDLLRQARQDAATILRADPRLAAPAHQELARRLASSSQARLGLVQVG
jgi:ATP-dependent DNA helicase RecG